MASKFTKKDLQRFQAECLDDKIQRSIAKIAEWFSRWECAVYVSFSGGIDSSVLADLCAKWCKIIGKPLYLVFSNTGLEYPEIQKHVKFFAKWLEEKHGIEVHLEIVRPSMRFDQVIKLCGYPIISKEVSNTIRGARSSIKDGVYSHRLCKLGVTTDEYGGLYDSGEHNYAESLEGSKFKAPKWRPLLDLDCDISDECCKIMKKDPLAEYEKRTGRKPIIGTMACESMNRENAWFKNGCNAFDGRNPKSTPMAFWFKQDVLRYVKEFKLPIASVYGEIVYENEPEQMRAEEFGLPDYGTERLRTTGCERTGCIFCGFGCHREKGTPRFEQLKQTHPRQYEYCFGGGEYIWRAECKDNSGVWQEFDLIAENGEPMTELEIAEFIESCKEIENFRFKKVWQPNKQGLGMRHVFDELNKIYGEDFIKY